MTTEALRALERIRGAKERKAKRGRHLAWRADFRKQQAEAKTRAETILSLRTLSRTDWDCIYMVVKNRRGPRMDQIERVNKLWVKYGFAGESDG